MGSSHTRLQRVPYLGFLARTRRYEGALAGSSDPHDGNVYIVDSAGAIVSHLDRVMDRGNKKRKVTGILGLIVMLSACSAIGQGSWA